MIKNQILKVPPPVREKDGIRIADPRKMMIIDMR